MIERMSNKKGFTMIELLVALTVFGIFLGLFLNTYLSLSQLLRETNDNRKVYIESRNVLSQLDLEMKKKTIDFDCYIKRTGSCSGIMFEDPSQGVTKTLVLISADRTDRVFIKPVGQQIQIYREKLDTAGNYMPATGFQYNAGKDLLGENVKLTSLNFVIQPLDSVDNLIKANKVPFHPRVTVLLSMEGKKVNFHLQKTISTRVYE